MKLLERKALSCLLIFSSLWLLTGFKETIALAMPQPQRMVLPNDLVVLLVEAHALPFVTFRLLIKAGSRKDPVGEEGLANLTVRGLLLGTTRRSDTTMNKELNFMGTALDTSCGRDYATISLQVLKKNLNKGFDLFMEAVTQPAFPSQNVRREQDKILGYIQSAEDQPGEVAEKAFREALFAGSSYGHPVEGTRQSVPRLTADELVKFYRTYYHTNNAILTIVGDISLAEAKAMLFPQLEQWAKEKIPDRPFKSHFAQGPKTIKIDRAITQANIVLGHGGVKRSNRDYYALSVMNYILGGGGFGSRLVEEIRIKRGLAYAVTSLFIPYKYPGSFQVILQTKNTSAREAISLVVEQIKKMQETPVSERELERAKKFLIGSFPLRFDTQDDLANFYSQVEYYKLGLDYAKRYSALIDSITQQDVLRVAKTYLHPKSFILTVVGNQKEIGLDAKP